jgi:hypothetical protein
MPPATWNARVYAASAMSRKVSARPDEWRTDPSEKTRSEAGTSSIADATPASFRRTSSAAMAAEDAPTRVARPLELPNPNGQRSVSPCTSVTRSGSRQRRSPTTCTIAVSLPPPGLVTPVKTLTAPDGPTRTVEVSKSPVIVPGMSAASGVSSNDRPTPTSRPAALAITWSDRALP